MRQFYYVNSHVSATQYNGLRCGAIDIVRNIIINDIMNISPISKIEYFNDVVCIQSSSIDIFLYSDYMRVGRAGDTIDYTIYSPELLRKYITNGVLSTDLTVVGP